MIEMNQIYFGPMDLYNNSFYGITNFFGPPLASGNYTGVFTSPNYCSQINTMVREGGSYISTPSFELGDTMRLEAEINNNFNEPISGGSGKLTFKSPTGQIVYEEDNLTSINGVVRSSDISLTSDLNEGIYEATVFWSNGQEVAFYTIQITITDPMKIFIIMGIIIGLAAISTPLALVVRKQIRQRNWEKSLKNLFVLNKDGLNVYEYSFGIEIQDPALISAMISALTNFIREATGSKKALKTVDQEDKKVILYHGINVTTAILGDKDLPIIHKRIKKFTDNFEIEFGKYLKAWDGDMSVFKGAEVLVSKYFPLDVEDQIIRGVRQKLIEFRETLDFLSDPKSIITLMRQITDFISRYQTIVNKHYQDYYYEIIRIAEEKISKA